MTIGKKIIIVDDSNISRLFLKSVFEENSFQVVGQFSSCTELKSSIMKIEHDYICLDYFLGDGTGVEAYMSIKQYCPKSKYMFVTSRLELSNLIEMYELGTCGIAYKENASSIKNMIVAGQEGGHYYDHLIANKILQFNLESKPLTKNEKMTFVKLMSGKSIQDLAEELSVNDRTIWRRRNEIINKLGRATFDRYCTHKIAI